MKISIYFGVAVGIATGLWMWCEFWLGLHTTYREMGRYTGALSVVLPIAGIVLALRHARIAEHAVWRFGRAMAHGAIVTLAASAVHTIMTAAYVYAINPQWAAGKPGVATALLWQSGVGAAVGGMSIAAITSLLMRKVTPERSK